MISRFFIDRPIFAAVISIFLVLAGLAAIRTLPIAQYPEIAPPTVVITAMAWRRGPVTMERGRGPAGVPGGRPPGLAPLASRSMWRCWSAWPE